MTRDELEAVIWGELVGCGSPRQQTVSVLKILDAADQYAIDQGGITAERRAVLAAGTRVIDRRRSLACAIHFHDGGPACRIPGATHATAVVANVNCSRCKDTRAYQRAAQEAAA